MAQSGRVEKPSRAAQVERAQRGSTSTTCSRRADFRPGDYAWLVLPRTTFRGSRTAPTACPTCNCSSAKRTRAKATRSRNNGWSQPLVLARKQSLRSRREKVHAPNGRLNDVGADAVPKASSLRYSFAQHVICDAPDEVGDPAELSALSPRQRALRSAFAEYGWGHCRMTAHNVLPLSRRI